MRFQEFGDLRFAVRPVGDQQRHMLVREGLTNGGLRQRGLLIHKTGNAPRRGRIDDFQESYFVISSFEDLFAETYKDFAAIYARLSTGPTYKPGEVLAADRVLTRGAHNYRAHSHAFS